MLNSTGRILRRLDLPVLKAVLLLALALLPAAAFAQGAASGQGTLRTETYKPAIWVDPDGCEHWVFDDGLQGYMTPHLTRQGKPVCRDRAPQTPDNKTACAVLNSDQLFRSGRARVSAANRNRLIAFFRKADARAFIIAGHTDSRGSERRNMALSLRRAQAVAEIAREAGVEVFDIQAYGETRPKADNRTAAGRAANRRVEVICMH